MITLLAALAIALCSHAIATRPRGRCESRRSVAGRDAARLPRRCATPNQPPMPRAWGLRGCRDDPAWRDESWT